MEGHLSGDFLLPGRFSLSPSFTRGPHVAQAFSRALTTPPTVACTPHCTPRCLAATSPRPRSQPKCRLLREVFLDHVPREARGLCRPRGRAEGAFLINAFLDKDGSACNKRSGATC